MHTTSVPREYAVDQAGRFDYHVCTRRSDRVEEFVVYPIPITERLPVLVIPLLPDDPEIEIDVQAVFDRCFDTGPYAREIDFQHDPVTLPLSPSAAAWAQPLLGREDLSPRD